MSSITWSYALHLDKQGNKYMTLICHTFVQVCLLTCANGVMKLIGWCPYEKEFDVFKPIEQNNRPKLGLAYNLLMMVVAYMTSHQFE